VSGTLLDGLDPTCVYFAAKLETPGELSLLIRGRAQPPVTKSAITAAVSAIDPDAAFQSFSIREGMGVITWIFQAFSVTTSLVGAIGLVLAFSGTYAVVAFVMTQRTREIGIRLAIGATVRQIVASMLKDTARTAAVGIIAGLAIAGAAVRLFRGDVPIIPGFAIAPYAIGAGVVLAATMLAALLPSLRAAKIDPAKALRVD
jgi:ABC-type antimicrobial peptide transport system permease subunit